MSKINKNDVEDMLIIIYGIKQTKQGADRIRKKHIANSLNSRYGENENGKRKKSKTSKTKQTKKRDS